MIDKGQRRRTGLSRADQAAALTGGQIRAARAFIRWDQETLAEHAALSVETIRALEESDGPIGGEHATQLAAVEHAFREAGVHFTHGANLGVRIVRADLDRQIREAQQRMESHVEASESMAADDASPRKGMAALRRGLSENTLRTLQKKKREGAEED